MAPAKVEDMHVATAMAETKPRIEYHETLVTTYHEERHYLARVERDVYGNERRVGGLQPAFTSESVVRTKTQYGHGTVTHSLAYDGGVQPVRSRTTASVFERF